MEERRVLIIDDSDEDRATVRQHLSRDPNVHYTFVEHATVQSGLEAFRSETPDCVILDFRLPDGDGLEFLNSVKRNDEPVCCPVVVLTGSASADAAASVIHAGADDYLLKREATADAVRIAVTHAIYRRRAQRDLLRQRNELERLYAEATARNEELGAAKEAAERANAAKDDFLATLSHELRTPLTPVLSIVSTTLAQNYASPDLRETFAMIRRNVELEARLIDDLLDLTQIASGRLAVEKHPVDIHACIQGALEICQVAFTDKNVAVHMDLEAQDTTVLGDSPRLHQVLWNLLKNAAKFTRPDGHVEIITANEGDRIVIEIRDSGIGIEPERLESIFGAFSGVRPQPSNTGLGLGLAITRAIIEAHGGKICASSEGRGQGAVFRICLPATRASPAVTHAQADDSGRDYRGRTVLVVEDHEDTRRVMLRVLRRKGFGVTVAGDVKSACEQFEHAHPDLVICDLGLPDGTGWDVLRRLREMSPVKAIAVSGFGMEHDVRKSREAGFAAHLTKPVDFPRLEAALALVLQDDAP